MTRQLPPIRYATFINAPQDRVYQALTQSSEWDRWFTTRSMIEARAGGRYRFEWVNFGGDRVTAVLEGLVTGADPPERFAFDWESGGDITSVTFTLHPRGPGTLVHVEEAGYTDTHESIVECLNCAAGWGEALTLLKFYLEHGVTYGAVPPE